MRTVGVVLAGGRSSRMGTDKSQLLVNGRPMVVHMASLLKNVGMDEVVISCKKPVREAVREAVRDVEGFISIADKTPFQGPAQGMLTVATDASLQNAERLLFVPVDMPLLTEEILQTLLAEQQSCYFTDCFLPCVLYKKNLQDVAEETTSVKHLLEQAGAVALAKPAGYENQFLNTNTPEAFEDAVKIL